MTIALARSRGADYQVGGDQGGGQFFPRPGPALPAVGQLGGPLEMPVQHGDRSGALVAEVSQRLLGHLAGPDHQRLLVGQPLEDLAGEIGHRHAGHAEPPAVDGRFIAHPPGDAQGRLERRVQQRAGRVVLGRRLVRLLHLGQDLRLAQHHALQAGGHGEQVPHGRLALVSVQVRGHLGRIELLEAGQETAHLLGRGQGQLARRVDLDPIAGREHHALHPAKHPPPLIQDLGELLGAHRQAFANRDRRAMMAATDDLGVHEPPPGAGTAAAGPEGDRHIFRPSRVCGAR